MKKPQHHHRRDDHHVSTPVSQYSLYDIKWIALDINTPGIFLYMVTYNVMLIVGISTSG